MDASWLDAGANTFSALGTVGAFLVGMILLRREQEREEVRAEDERRSQAVKVSAWFEPQRTAHGGRELSFFVHNASDMPIYEVSLPLAGPPGPADDDNDGDAEEDLFIGLLPPGQTVQRPTPSGWHAAYSAPEPVAIEFVDSSGWHWTRDEEGTLTRGEPSRIGRWQGPASAVQSAADTHAATSRHRRRMIGADRAIERCTTCSSS